MSWMTKEKWLTAVKEALERVSVEDKPDGVVTLPQLLKALMSVRQTEMAEEYDTLAFGDGTRAKSEDSAQSDLLLAQYLNVALDEVRTGAVRQFRTPS